MLIIKHHNRCYILLHFILFLCNQYIYIYIKKQKPLTEVLPSVLQIDVALMWHTHQYQSNMQIQRFEQVSIAHYAYMKHQQC